MKFKTIIIVFLLPFLIGSLHSCKSSDLPTSDADVQKQLYKEKKKKGRAAKRIKKKELKHYWSLQTKSVKKSLKKNNRYQKRKARKLKK